MVDTGVVLELADTIESHLRAFVLLAGFGALRTGELLGLRRRDVDIARSQVAVRQQLHELRGRGRVLDGDLKSEAGRRVVTLPRFVVEALAEHLTTYAAPDADDPVFIGKQGGALYRSALAKAWTRACEEVGVSGLHVHDLRHHGATLTARMPGVTTKELMARIGHASPRAALLYQHATEERDRAVATFLDDQIRVAQEGLRDKRAMAGTSRHPA